MTGNSIEEDLLSEQDLFSVYVHAPEGYDYSKSNLFWGREISDPVNTTNGFGNFAVVEAELRLLSQALKDPRNQKFVLLSESCVPIHRPEIVYLQLMSERKSRINSCERSPKELSLYRYFLFEIRI